jgi:hypothetical protein
MRKTILSVLVMLIIFVFNGCTPDLTKRYQRLLPPGTIPGGGHIKISTFTLDIPPSPSKNSLFRMSPEGQAAFIEAIGKKTSSIGTLLKSLGGNIGTSKKSGDIIDLTKFKKRVVFSVEKQTFGGLEIGPADRIDQLLIDLSILQNAVFVSWDKFETKYETVDLGKITSTQEFNLGLEIPIKNPDVNTTIGAKQGLTEEILLRQRYVELTGRLDKKNAHLYQQGVMGIDLAGNFSVDFTIEIDQDSIASATVTSLKNLWKGSIPNNGKDIQISFLELIYPNFSTPISCGLVSKYSLRHVEKNGRTIIEGDDVVKFIRGGSNQPNTIELVRKEELKVRVFYIVTDIDPKSKKPSKNSFILHLHRFDKMPIYFFDYENAKSFLDWLQLTKNLTVGDYKIILPMLPQDKPLGKNDIPNLYVKGEFLN